jgi:hypothetical protein
MKIDLKDAQAMLSQMTVDANDLLDKAQKADSAGDIIATTAAIIMIQAIGFALENLSLSRGEASNTESTANKQMQENQPQELSDAHSIEFEDTERLNQINGATVLPCPLLPC